MVVEEEEEERRVRMRRMTGLVSNGWGWSRGGRTDVDGDGEDDARELHGGGGEEEMGVRTDEAGDSFSDRLRHRQPSTRL